MEGELLTGGQPGMDRRSMVALLLITVIWMVCLPLIWPAPRKPAGPGGVSDKPGQSVPPGDHPAVPPVQGDPASPAAPPSLGNPPVAGPGPVGPAAPAPAAWQEPEPATLTLANEHLRVTLTNRGAAVSKLELLQFPGALPDTANVILSEIEEAHPSFLLRDESGAPPLPTIRWKAEPSADQVKYVYEAPNGLTYQKIFRLRAEDPKKPEECYVLGLTLVLENRTDTNLMSRLDVEGAAGIEVESDSFRTDLRGQLGASEDGDRWKLVEITAVTDLAKTNKAVAGERASWVAISSKYFASVLMPGTPSEVSEYFLRPISELELVKKALAGKSSPSAEEREQASTAARANLLCGVRLKEFAVAPRSVRTFRFSSYNGPKRDEDLRLHAAHGLDNLLDYGWAGGISRILLWILGMLHGLFGNYGWSIIGLTLIVKLCLFPLTRKSQISMFRMQKLQPEFMRLKEKYGEDKQKLNVEVMNLYKENGVNPLGGCLPIFFQIPVFIGLYNALNYAIDLRQQPWVGWVHNLSQPDVLWNMPFSLLGHTELHLLPLVMTATWFVQSLTQPKSPDPQVQQQQKMFMVMPIFFGLMMYSMPAGLILYWLTSTMLAIGEQQLIKRVILPRAA
ncbi:MAG: membrane protein insertase YidC [Planctomycetes bacterium]|nr:membrane protein insertase YidC [Planctomycetota bacterium]